MAVIKAFRAIRPSEDMAHRVAALPYDVMSREEAVEMARGNEYSFLRVDRPEIEFDSGVSFDNPLAYKKASENLKGLMAQGVLEKDPTDYLYIYQLESEGYSQAGLVTCLAVDDYLEGVIKKHEHTRQDKELDRTKHILECNAHTGPILLFYREQRDIGEVMEQWMRTKIPVYDFVSEDGVAHRVWVIDSREVVQKLIGIFGGVDSLYIADGHHRCAAAARACLERRKGGYSGDEEFNFFLGVIFPHNELRVLDYNRIVDDLNGLGKEEFLQKIISNTGTGPLFEVSPVEVTGAYRPQNKHSFGMYIEDRWYRLDSIPGTWDKKGPIERLDVSILQKNLLNPVLGIKDPRTDKRIEFIGGIRGLEELERRVDRGAAVAFSLYPTSIKDLMDVADAGLVMPPKSTWFEPKLRSGLFVHYLG
ncbi:MAG: DUF1015 family protein [Firmicutes bacterium]|nr:DUF1015 family protein [Bacillota bacterium]